MRTPATILAVALLTGAAMSPDATLDAQEKKPAAKPVPKAPFTELVTFREWAASEQKFGPPRENVEAYRSKSKDGTERIHLKRAGRTGVPSDRVPLKSEIVDKDGKVYVVTKASPIDVYHLCEVTPKKP